MGLQRFDELLEVPSTPISETLLDILVFGIVLLVVQWVR
jgi:hypothetical protein